MLILIFRYKTYIGNRFNKVTLHEIALWCCKIIILEVCWKTPISLYVTYKRCSLVIVALKFSSCNA
jgi:hypothetical protein